MTGTGRYWCECKKCGDGRLCSRSTWFRHNGARERRVYRRTTGTGTVDGGGPAPASPLDDIYVKEPSPDSKDHQDEVMTSARSDAVSIVR